MRKLNFFLLFILILMLAAGGYAYFGSTLIVGANSITASASDYPDVFSSIQSIVSSGNAPQTFSDSLPESADGLTLADVTITLENRGILAAEWLDIRIDGLAGDIAVYSLTGQGTDIAAHSSAQLNLKLLTAVPSGTMRTATVSYYVFGILRSVEITF